MSAIEPKRRRKHSPLWVLGAVVAVMLVIFIWLIATPGPTSFAGGEPVALTQYRGPDPTGVPSELKGQASSSVGSTSHGPRIAGSATRPRGARHSPARARSSCRLEHSIRPTSPRIPRPGSAAIVMPIS
jgi:hypothetical protein